MAILFIIMDNKNKVLEINVYNFEVRECMRSTKTAMVNFFKNYKVKIREIFFGTTYMYIYIHTNISIIYYLTRTNDDI